MQMQTRERERERRERLAGVTMIGLRTKAQLRRAGEKGAGLRGGPHDP